VKSTTKKQASDTREITLPSALTSLPLLDGELSADYENFQIACYSDLKPKGMIENIWVDDFIQYEWEIIRLRRMRVSILQSSRQDALSRLLQSIFPYNEMNRDERKSLAFDWSTGQTDAVERIDTILKAHDLSSDAIISEAFKTHIDTFDKIDRLIENCTRRRDAAIRDLDKRRDDLAARMRKLASTVSDATFVDVDEKRTEPDH